MQTSLFSELGLSAEVLRAVERLGFEQASPIQAAAIPVLLGGRDVVGQSHTGSGKTAAFAIPAIERIDLAAAGPQVLILCPTRELAMQVTEEVHKLAFFKRGIRAVPIYGGASYNRQFADLRAQPQIVVGTPGRLIDHLERGTLDLSRIRIAILDEADEMLNMGFRDAIETLLTRTPAERQTVLFSATVPRGIEELIGRHTRDAARIRMEAPTLTVPTVEQVCFEVDRRWKFEALTRLVDLHDITLGIIFANTQREVTDLSDHLSAAGYSADCIHGGMQQSARERVMQKFRKRQVELLVATDVAARGIDVEDVQAVINFDLPYNPEDYVHRIGRTGRAGRHGLALSLMSGREVFLIRSIERLTRQRLRRGEIPTLGEIEDARQGQMLGEVRETLRAGDFRHYDKLLEVLLEEGFDSLDVANALIHHLFGNADDDAKAAAAGKEKRPKTPAGPGAPARPARPAIPAAKAAQPAPAPAAPSDAAAAPAAEPSPEPPPQAAEAPSEPATPPDEADQAVAALETPKPASIPPAPPARKEPAPSPRRPSVAAPQRPDRPFPARDNTRPDRGPARPFDSRPARAPFGDRPDRPQRGERPLRPDRPDRMPRPERMGAPNRAERPAPARPPKAPATPRPPAGAAPSPNPAAASAPAPTGPAELEAMASGKRQEPSEYTRLWMSVGEEHGATQETLRNFILGTTGEPAAALRSLDVRSRHSFVDVPTPRAQAYLSRLKRAQFGDHRLKVKPA